MRADLQAQPFGRLVTRHGISDSQADALAQRDRPYSAASEMSFKFAYDYHQRVPTTLTEAVDMIRAAYADEVPMRLHEGPDSIGEGGTPKMDARAEGYIMGSDQAGEAPRDIDGERPALDYYRTPFRAALAQFKRQSPKRGAIVQHIAIGSMGPIVATTLEGVPNWCARVVAEDTCRAFLRSLSDVKLDVAKRPVEAA